MKKALETIIGKIERLDPLTSEEKKQYILYAICSDHTGKMENMKSLSTSCLLNEYCQERQKNKNSICSKCYAAAQCERYTTLAKKLERNTIFFSYYELKKEDIPLLNILFFRFESFGDLRNLTQLGNYYLFASVNKKTTFVLWSKNLFLLDQIDKPKNVINVYSNPYIDKPISLEYWLEFQKQHRNIDKYFSVFTNKYAAENKIKINCGANNCFTCLKCYTRKKENILINELLK